MMADTPENISGNQETDLDWESRRLCRDDSCIGVIGADGRCRVCGLQDTITPVESDRPTDRNPVQEESRAPSEEDPPPESGDDPGWEDRKLCSDESCIGTIGRDGRCGICGLKE